MPNEVGGWSEYQRLVLSELKRLDEAIEKLVKSVNQLSRDVEMLKVKAGIWGAVGASIPVAVWLVLQKVAE